MGAFYGSIHVRTDDRQSVVEALGGTAKRKHRFLVAPSLNGWVSIYPNHHGQDERVSKKLAKRLYGELIHLIDHDDDVLCYFFYRDGKLIDRFNSRPDYFEPVSQQMKSRLRGKPERLSHLLGGERQLEELRNLLETMRSDPPVFASEGLERLAELFGIRNVLTAYEYLMNEETDDIEGWDQFVHVPDLSEEQRQKQEQTIQLQREKDRLRDEEVLLMEVVPETTMRPPKFTSAAVPVWCADPIQPGFLVAWRRPDLWSGEDDSQSAFVERLGPPWTKPLPTDLDVETQVAVMTASLSGRYIATGHYGKACLWDPVRERNVLEVEHTSLVSWVGFTPDERVLITVSTAEVILTDVETKGTVSQSGCEEFENAGAVHPVEGFFVLGGRKGLAIFDLANCQCKATLFIEQDEFREALRLMAGEANGEEMDQATEDALRDLLEGLHRSFVSGLGTDPAQTKRSEIVCELAFSPDGSQLFCATTSGVRVFTWDDVLAAAEDAPEPVLSVDSEPILKERGGETHLSQGCTYTLAHDPARNRLLYGGLDGTLRFLDLETGQSGKVMSIPGEPPITQMAFSGDYSTLCVTCDPNLRKLRGRREGRQFLQVWDYSMFLQVSESTGAS